MKSQIIAQGAEATITLVIPHPKKSSLIIKDRIPKTYRLKELDGQIRRRRTKSETKLLDKASKVISVPSPIINSPLGGVEGNTQFQIQMPFIKGQKLSEHLDSFPLAKQKRICRKMGESIAKLHEQNIIHDDLTTSNMILKNGELFIIDFGLGFVSHKYEDKAVDLHLLKQALEAKHFKHWETLIEEVLKGYKKNPDATIIFERLKAVEKRGRYKH